MTDKLGHAPPHTYLDRARRGFERSGPSRKVVAGARPIRKIYYVLARSLASRSRSAAARSAKAATFWHRSAKSTTFWHEPIRKSCYVLARARPRIRESCYVLARDRPQNPSLEAWPIRKSCYVLAPIRKIYYVLARVDPQKLLRFGSRSAESTTFWIAIRKSCYVLARRSAESTTFWIAIRKSCYVLARGHFRRPPSQGLVARRSRASREATILQEKISREDLFREASLEKEAIEDGSPL